MIQNVEKVAESSSPPHFEQGATTVYTALAEHQRNMAWDRREIFGTLQAWAERFVFEFKLKIPEVALCIDPLPVKTLGHFRCGYNGFGLQREIALNELYLGGALPPWRVLGVLLHELLHGWQEVHGKSGKHNYHNVEYQKKAGGLGLIVDGRGITTYADESPFKDLLIRYGVDVPLLSFQAPPPKQQGVSKLKKWRCGCTNVRVAVPGFRALCLNCGNEFAQVEKRRLELP
jgi:hypothetical protein